MSVHTSLVSAILCLSFAIPAAAETPRGSITIDRIAQIKYPSAPAWSPDGTRVAFLWDAWGKQDLFVVTPGQKPVALTDFPVDPDIRTSDISSFAWVSADEILFAKDGVFSGRCRRLRPGRRASRGGSRTPPTSRSRATGS